MNLRKEKKTKVRRDELRKRISEEAKKRKRQRNG